MTLLKRIIYLFFAIALLPATNSVTALDEDQVTAPVSLLEAPLRPSILSSDDIATYQKIFELQENGRWKSADKQIKKLDNDLLMGHLLFQRYMHPTKYRSRYSELAAWMKFYADHPFARRIYRLGDKRKGKLRGPKKPVATHYPGVTGQAGFASPPAPRRSTTELAKISKFRSDFRRNLRRDRLSRAERSYWAMERNGLWSGHEEADLLDMMAAFYFYSGYDKKARAYAERGILKSGETVPNLYWIAGMASYRMGEMHRAESHFAVLAKTERADNRLASAGSFWASRIAFQDRRAEEGFTYLADASQYRESFYGLIAARQLGADITYNWAAPTLTEKTLKKVMKEPGARRAVALTEIGRDDLADEELRLLWARKGIKIQDEVAALAARLRLPAIQLRLGRTGGTTAPPPIAIRYPMPDWAPAGGFTVDRAFIYAKMRQESAFKSTAQSGPGARGLMQITPATASIIAADNSLYRNNRKKLYQPEFNMALGQQYINYLENMDLVDGNLFMLLAAYNAGPGSLQRWKGDIDYHNDPLLFIESIPFRETRAHIEIVMANLWIYRMRLGQETPSLDVIAEGGWPTLERLDPKSDELLANITHNRRNGTRARSGQK